MGILSELEPKKVFSFFEQLCAVPHGSGNTKQISDLCVRFARERGLEWHQDSLGNVILIAPASPGYEAAEPIILQGHLDMVCVKTPDCPLDLTRDGLELAVEGDYVFARGTSLGGDDGIAVAMALAVLDSPELPKPRVEAVFTVDEETGMDGAAGIDLAPLRGRKLVNLDSEAEGIFTVSCAGGLHALCTVPVRREALTLPRCRLTVDGLRGGHSGVEIHKGRANANILLGQVLSEAAARSSVRLVSLSGGTADNVIARQAQAMLAGNEAALAAVRDAAARCQARFREKYARTDPDISIRAELLGADSVQALTRDATNALWRLLPRLPQGVQAMSQDIPGLVQTSLNLGRTELTNQALELHYSLRSSIAREKTALLARLRELLDIHGGSVDTDGDYPAWEYRENSPLRERMVEIYTEQYGAPPRIEAIHAGLECGLLCGKKPELDCVSIGPDILDIHSVNERLSISSVQRVWRFLTELLLRSTDVPAAEKMPQAASFRTMRRGRQQLSPAESRDILDRGSSGVLALAGDNGYPYAVPLSFVRYGEKLYFHSAVAGHKLDAVAREARASFCVIDRDQVVPETFTTHYRSVIVFGRVTVLTDEAEKGRAIRLLAEKYAPGHIQAGEAEIRQSWQRFCILCLEMEHLTGKQAMELTQWETNENG